MNNKSIIKRCEIQGLRMTDQRRTIATLLDSITDHPDVEELHRRINEVDRSISLATVYRTVKLFEESGILEKLEFGDGRARYEDADREHATCSRSNVYGWCSRSNVHGYILLVPSWNFHG